MHFFNFLPIVFFLHGDFQKNFKSKETEKFHIQ